MFWRQKRVARASEGAAVPILMRRPAGGPWPETNRLALRRAGVGAAEAEEKALMLRLLSTAPAATNRLPALTPDGVAPATPSANATPPAEQQGAAEVAGQHEHEHEHEGGAAWRAIGPQ